jgi:hypothetical protein
LEFAELSHKRQLQVTANSMLLTGFCLAWR